MCSTHRKTLPPELSKTKGQSHLSGAAAVSILWMDIVFGCRLRPWQSAHGAVSVTRQIYTLPWTSEPGRQVAKRYYRLKFSARGRHSH